MADENGSATAGRAGFDPAIADQLTLQALTSAITQQQLNAAAARSQLANQCNVLTMSVQLTQAAALKQLTHLSPLAAAAANNLMRAAYPQQFAGLNVAAR